MNYVNRLANLSSLKSFAPAGAAASLRLHDGRSHTSRPALDDGLYTSSSKIKSILVPLDGSPFAEHAIPLAVAIAEQSGAILNVVHVIAPAEVLDPYDVLYFADLSIKSLKRDKEKYLESVVERVADESSAFVVPRVIDGRTVSTSLDNVPGLDANLVVMATRGRGPLGRFWSGSVAHSLLQRMTVPMILVPASDDPVTFGAEPIEHVLLPFDGSEASEKVLRAILDLELFPTSRHSLLHVVPLKPQHVVRNYALHTDWVPSRRRWMAGMQYLNPLARSIQADGRVVHTKVVSSDEPFWQVALRAAEQDDVGLIAVTYRRQWPLTRLLWPNTSEYLFRKSFRPIMFVPNEPPS